GGEEEWGVASAEGEDVGGRIQRQLAGYLARVGRQPQRLHRKGVLESAGAATLDLDVATRVGGDPVQAPVAEAEGNPSAVGEGRVLERQRGRDDQRHGACA